MRKTQRLQLLPQLICDVPLTQGQMRNTEVEQSARIIRFNANGLSKSLHSLIPLFQSGIGETQIVVGVGPVELNGLATRSRRLFIIADL